MHIGRLIGFAWGPALLLSVCGAASAKDAKDLYPAMAPYEQYQSPSPTAEVALARSAAPASISNDADILTLGRHGYETAAKGHNGFVCMVERSWAAGFDDPEFWNPKVRGPICFNPSAARSVVPGNLERTKWILEGVSKADLIARTKTALAAHTYILPEPGAMSFMMSKDGYLSGVDGHWRPHLMFFVANTDGAAWGANLAGSPIMAAKSDPDPVTTFMIPVTKWSDGTAAAAMH